MKFFNKNIIALICISATTPSFAQEVAPKEVPEYVLRQQQMRLVSRPSLVGKSLVTTAKKLPIKGVYKAALVGAAACAAYALQKYPPQPAGVCPLSNATPVQKRQWFWAQQMARSTPLKKGFAGTNREYLERRQQEILDEYHEKYLKPSQDITAFRNVSPFPQYSQDELEKMSQTGEEKETNHLWLLKKYGGYKFGIHGRDLILIYNTDTAQLPKYMRIFGAVVSVTTKVYRSENKVSPGDTIEPGKFTFVQQVAAESHGKPFFYRVCWRIEVLSWTIPLHVEENFKRLYSVITGLQPPPKRILPKTALAITEKSFYELSDIEQKQALSWILPIISISPTLAHAYVNSLEEVQSKWLKACSQYLQENFSTQNVEDSNPNSAQIHLHPKLSETTLESLSRTGEAIEEAQWWKIEVTNGKIRLLENPTGHEIQFPHNFLPADFETGVIHVNVAFKVHPSKPTDTPSKIFVFNQWNLVGQQDVNGKRVSVLMKYSPPDFKEELISTFSNLTSRPSSYVEPAGEEWLEIARNELKPEMQVFIFKGLKPAERAFYNDILEPEIQASPTLARYILLEPPPVIHKWIQQSREFYFQNYKVSVEE